MSRGRNGGKSTGTNQNLVTILFVLGIIGWGFFAIDRLTETEGSPRGVRSQGRALGQEAGWKKTARDWLNKKLSSSTDKRPAPDGSVSRNIPQEDLVPVMPEPKGLKMDREDEAPGSEKRIEIGDSVTDSTVFLFYRLNSKGQPVLARLQRPPGEDLDLKSRVGELIKGPSIAEQDKDFIDSFVRKPRILGARMDGTCAVINFDQNFGAGVSYQTLRFQVQQIFRNIALWENATCLELKVGGKYSPHLGSDGLFFPKRIDAAWLKQNL